MLSGHEIIMINKNGRFFLKENNDGTYSYIYAQGNLKGSFDTYSEACEALDEEKEDADTFDYNED